MKPYRAKKDIRRKLDGKVFSAGSTVELDLSPQEEMRLVEAGMIETLSNYTEPRATVASRNPLPPITTPYSPSDNTTPLGQMGQETAQVGIWAPFTGKGQHADAWADLFDSLGSRAGTVFQRVQQCLEDRQIPNAQAKVETLTDKGVGVEKRRFFTIQRGVATVALYIAPFGKDLYASWDTFVLPKISRVRVAIAFLLRECF